MQACCFGGAACGPFSPHAAAKLSRQAGPAQPGLALHSLALRPLLAGARLAARHQAVHHLREVGLNVALAHIGVPAHRMGAAVVHQRAPQAAGEDAFVALLQAIDLHGGEGENKGEAG